MLILGLKELNNVAMLVNVHVPEEKAQTQKSALVRGPDCWFSELQYILHLRTVTEQSTTNLQMLSWGLITFLLRNLSPHIMLMKSE